MPIADNYLLKKEYARVLLMVEKGELDSKVLNYYNKSIKKKVAKAKTQDDAGADKGGGDSA